MLSVTVEGGTNAGRRRPFQGSAPMWECKCVILVPCTHVYKGNGGDLVWKPQPGYMVACSVCGTRRP